MTRELSSDVQTELFPDQLASSSDQEISEVNECDVDECESVLAEDSGGEDCEYLYRCPPRLSRNPPPEYASLQEYATWTNYSFYENESSSDDANDVEYDEEDDDKDRDSDGNSILSGESCTDEHELADVQLEDTLLDFDLELSSRDVRVLADSVAPSLGGRAPQAAGRKLMRMCLQEERRRAVLMALHPRLGRDSLLRHLDPGVVIYIANLSSPIAAVAPQFAAFEDFVRAEREEEAEWAEAMHAELEATSDEDDDDDEEEKGEQEEEDAGKVPTMSSIVASAVAGSSLCRGDGESGACDSERPPPLPPPPHPPAPGCRLDDEAMEALERAGEGYLQDMQLLAAAVSALLPSPVPCASAPRFRRRRAERNVAARAPADSGAVRSARATRI